jgi:hypothetical protein
MTQGAPGVAHPFRCPAEFARLYRVWVLAFVCVRCFFSTAQNWTLSRA